MGLDLQLTQVPTGVLDIHHINDILAGKSTKKQEEVTLRLVIGTMTSGSWAINPGEVQDPTQQVHFLGVTWAQSQRSILERVKGLLALVASTTKKEVQHLIDLFGSWRQHVPHLDVLLFPLVKVTHEAISFESCPLLQQV